MYSGCIGQIPNSDISSYESVLLLLLFLASDPSALTPASEPSDFGISAESSASDSFKSATFAPNSSDSCQLSISIS